MANVKMYTAAHRLCLSSGYSAELVKLYKKHGCQWHPVHSIWTRAMDGCHRLIQALEQSKHRLIGVEQVWADLEQHGAMPSWETEQVPAWVPDGLFKYQKHGVAFAARMRRALIGDEQGLGKTAQALAAMDHLKPERLLIVAPASTLENWRREAARWLHRETSVITIENASKGKYAEVVITAYDTLKTRNMGEFDGIIADEAHMIKNPQTMRHKAVVAIADQCRYVLALSGTPIASRPKDLWGIARLVIGKDGCPTFRDFTRRYCQGHDQGGHWWANGASNLGALNRFFRSFSIRRTKAEVMPDLPEKTHQLVWIDEDRKTSHTEARIIGLIHKHGSVDAVLDHLGVDGRRKLQADAIVEYHQNAAIKAGMKPFLEHIENVIGQDDEKTLIFCDHHEMMDKMIEICDKASVDHIRIDGDVKTNKRQPLIDRLNEAPGPMVGILSMGAASTGLNIQAATRVIFAELPWSPSQVSQAEARAHRIGQRNCVNVQSIIATGFDDLLQSVLLTKAGVIGAAVDGGNGQSEEMGNARAMVEAVWNRLEAAGQLPAQGQVDQAVKNGRPRRSQFAHEQKAPPRIAYIERSGVGEL